MKKINKVFLELYNDRKQLLSLSVFLFICLQIQNLTPEGDPNIIQCTGWIAGAMIGGTVIMGAIGAWQTSSANKNAEDAQILAGENLEMQEVPLMQLSHSDLQRL